MEHDRRLACRYGVADEAVEWKPGSGMSVRRRGWLRDVSVTGVRLIVSSAEHVEVGLPLEVSLDGTAGFTGLVRWKMKLRDWTHCGVEYIDTNAGYRRWGLGVLMHAEEIREDGQVEPSAAVRA